jgi:endoglucanase
MGKKGKIIAWAVNKIKPLLIMSGLLIFFTSPLDAAKLVSVKVLDKDYLMVHIMDGEVLRRDDGTGNCAFMGHCHSPDGSHAVRYEPALDTEESVLTSNWTVKSTQDSEYGRRGKSPEEIFRKTKLNGMSISHWDPDAKPNGDYVYDTTLEHYLYLKLPKGLEQGKTYTLEIGKKANTDIQKVEFVYDIFQSRSEAIRVNIWGYLDNESIKAADLYHWMGDGGARDYSSFQGKKVYIYDLETGKSEEVGKVSFWQKSAVETENHNFTMSDVWNVDFTRFNKPGTYRLAIEGVGCSDDFVIAPDVYKDPFVVSTLGFFYMRLGQDSPDINPRPRLPLFIPGVDNTTAYISTLHPYHPDWEGIRARVTDPWDHPREFEPYTTGRTNPDAWGGHSDAYDWDKRLPHVSTIYDMLLPYILTNGSLSNDDMGIAESGNGIPDLLDEVRYEVDAWLRLRDGKGYAHGLTCPYSEENRVKFQGGTTAVAAWANALNCAMLAEAFHISGHKELRNEYLDSALVAFHYANNLEDPMLDNMEGDGVFHIRGRDFKMMAAAWLYNLTGETFFEDAMKQESVFISENAPISVQHSHNQVWGIVPYILTRQKVNYPELQHKMKMSVINDARRMEAGYTLTRPSRRATCNNGGYFWTIHNMQRTIIAHAISEDPADREFFLNALILEADFGLGRNPANMIQMTTASTSMSAKRSVEFAYTSGYNDGTPGLHPGHTPYWNMNDWAPNMIMGRPSWMAAKGYPAQRLWPTGELFFNTDYVWSHTEFTPQQTMRGKTALYGYLYGLSQTDK